MGGRNADRVPIQIRRSKCETVGAVHEAGWDVLSKCGSCGLIMRVDLLVVARVSGSQTSLWNRKARCRRVGCAGWVEFQARAPAMTSHEALRAGSE